MHPVHNHCVLHPGRSINKAVFNPNPVNLAASGATRVQVTSSYARSGPFTAGTWSGSVVLANPNPGPVFVNDVWVSVQYKDGRRTTAVRTTCPRGARGLLEVPGGGRRAACTFGFTAPVRAKTQVVRLQARAEVVGAPAVTLTTDLSQLSKTPGYEQQEGTSSPGACASVLEAFAGDLQATLVRGSGPFNRPVRVCSSTAFSYQLQLLGPLLGSCAPLRVSVDKLLHHMLVVWPCHHAPGHHHSINLMLTLQQHTWMQQAPARPGDWLQVKHVLKYPSLCCALLPRVCVCAAGTGDSVSHPSGQRPSTGGPFLQADGQPLPQARLRESRMAVGPIRPVHFPQ
jgi:hypothetical protein